MDVVGISTAIGAVDVSTVMTAIVTFLVGVWAFKRVKALL